VARPDGPQRLARCTPELGDGPSEHSWLVRVVGDVAQHLDEEDTTTHRRRQLLGEQPDLGAPFQRLVAQRVDGAADLGQSSLKLRVLCPQSLELGRLVRHPATRYFGRCCLACHG
jgi:hypothetical protein